MKDFYSKKEAIEILERALNKKDQETETYNELITTNDFEKMAANLSISKAQLEQAATEIISTREQNRNEMHPEVVSSRWISGKLTDQEIETFLSDLRIEFGGAKTWDGSPVELHKIGKTWEYALKDATILIKEESSGYQLQVIKHQFFHGNKLEASIIAFAVAFILGLLPVAASEWIHIYAAIFIAAVFYFFSFLLVKKFTSKKRSETVSKLLRITEYVEQKLRKIMGKKQVDLDATSNQTSENVDSAQNPSPNRL